MDFIIVFNCSGLESNMQYLQSMSVLFEEAFSFALQIMKLILIISHSPK